MFASPTRHNHFIRIEVRHVTFRVNLSWTIGPPASTAAMCSGELTEQHRSNDMAVGGDTPGHLPLTWRADKWNASGTDLHNTSSARR